MNMMRFRIRLWTRQGFAQDVQYATAASSRGIRRRLEREHGREVARNSAVTAYADVEPGLNPDFRGVR